MSIKVGGNIVRDYFPNWMDSGGIFIEMTTQPWFSQSVAIYLDELYFGNHSGRKHPSPLVRALRDGEDTLELTRVQREQLAHIAELRYGYAWEMRWKGIQAILDEQDPLNTYKSTVSKSGTNTVTTQHGKTETHSGTDSREIKKAEIPDANGSDTFEVSGSKVTTTVEAGKESNRRSFSGKESSTHSYGGKETNKRTFSGTESNTRSGTVHEADAGPEKTYTFGFDSEESPGSAGDGGNLTQVVGHDNTHDTAYQNVRDVTAFEERTNLDEKTFTDRTDTDEKTFDNRADLDEKTFDGRTTTVTETPSNYTETTKRGQRVDTNTTDELVHGERLTYGGTDMVTETPRLTTTEEGYRNKYALLDRVTTLHEFMDFYESVFNDVDQILTIGVY